MIVGCSSVASGFWLCCDEANDIAHGFSWFLFKGLGGLVVAAAGSFNLKFILQVHVNVKDPAATANKPPRSGRCVTRLQHHHHMSVVMTEAVVEVTHMNSKPSLFSLRFFTGIGFFVVAALSATMLHIPQLLQHLCLAVSRLFVKPLTDAILLSDVPQDLVVLLQLRYHQLVSPTSLSCSNTLSLSWLLSLAALSHQP